MLNRFFMSWFNLNFYSACSSWNSSISVFLSSYRVSSFKRHSSRISLTRGSIECAFNSSFIFDLKLSWGFDFCYWISAITFLLWVSFTSPRIFDILFVELSLTVSSEWWFNSVTSETKSATSSSVSSIIRLPERIREIANPILLAKPPP